MDRKKVKGHRLALCILPVLAIAIPIFCFEVFLLIQLMEGETDIYNFLLMHCFTTMMLFFLSGLCKYLNKDSRVPILMIFSTVLMGPLGAFGCILVILLEAFYQHTAMSFEEWYASLFPEELEKYSEKLFETLQLIKDTGGDDAGLMPFMEILTFGTMQQKQMTIALMAKNYNPAFSFALKMATQDSQNAIRVQAASAIAMVENQFLNKAMNLEGELEKHAENKEILLHLGIHYDNYAFTGLLDEDRVNDCLHKSLAAYKAYLESNRDHLKAVLAVGRLLLKIKSAEESSQWYQAALMRGLDSVNLRFWYIESLYQLGNFKELRNQAEIINTLQQNEDDEMTTTMKEIIKIWTLADEELMDIVSMS